jgi:Ca2+-binding EF-hand superfamily protein
MKETAMRSFLFLGVLAAVLCSQRAMAEEAKKPEQARHEGMFKHLDANHDGALVREEMPPFLKDRFDDLLAKFDKNGDKKLQKEEVAEMVKQMPPPGWRPGFDGRPGPWAGGPQHGDRPGPWAGGAKEKEAERRDAPRGGPAPHAWWIDRPERSYERPSWGDRPGWGPRPDGQRGEMRPGMEMARAMFQRMDRDCNGQLSFHEFALGMARLHQARQGGWRPHGYETADRPMMGWWAYSHHAWGFGRDGGPWHPPAHHESWDRGHHADWGNKAHHGPWGEQARSGQWGPMGHSQKEMEHAMTAMGRHHQEPKAAEKKEPKCAEPKDKACEKKEKKSPAEKK